jgi:hypothetical protein
MDLMPIGIALVVAALAVVVIAGRRGPGSAPAATPEEAMHPDEAVLDGAATGEEPIESDEPYEETIDGDAPHDEAAHDAAWDDAAPDDSAPDDEARDDDAPEDDEVGPVSVHPGGRTGFSPADGEALSDDRVTPPTAAAVTAAPADPHVDAPDARPEVAPPPATASERADACPTCGSPMVERVAKRGPREGRPFMACTRYPTCRTAFEIVGAAGGEAQE